MIALGDLESEGVTLRTISASRVDEMMGWLGLPDMYGAIAITHLPLSRDKVCEWMGQVNRLQAWDVVANGLVVGVATYFHSYHGTPNAYAHLFGEEDVGVVQNALIAIAHGVFARTDHPGFCVRFPSAQRARLLQALRDIGFDEETRRADQTDGLHDIMWRTTYDAYYGSES